MKLNNKGFAVSAILYSLLTVFILFMLVVLNSMNNSITVLKSSNDDIINGDKFDVSQVYENEEECNQNGWYNYESTKKLEIKTNYDVLYWPKDFNDNNKDKKNGWVEIVFTAECSSEDIDFDTITSKSMGDEPKCVYLKNSLTGSVINKEIGNICGEIEE